ncbi:Hypothetical_protein [Hexamita inflata]|uniref:Hypothetical_protein n=1 Tax=Hexamita inflata TaxID=28002 RepID=A0AA86TP23_9EUKA|nr:Hypothetical protein HINF_LOCUS11969 [Hexamita inflata]
MQQINYPDSEIVQETFRNLFTAEMAIDDAISFCIQEHPDLCEKYKHHKRVASRSATRKQAFFITVIGDNDDVTVGNAMRALKNTYTVIHWCRIFVGKIPYQDLPVCFIMIKMIDRYEEKKCEFIIKKYLNVAPNGYYSGSKFPCDYLLIKFCQKFEGFRDHCYVNKNPLQPNQQKRKQAALSIRADYSYPSSLVPDTQLTEAPVQKTKRVRVRKALAAEEPAGQAQEVPPTQDVIEEVAAQKVLKKE